MRAKESSALHSSAVRLAEGALFESMSEMSGPGEDTRGEEFFVPWEWIDSVAERVDPTLGRAMRRTAATSRATNRSSGPMGQ
jgi:hypothetical protein